MSKFKRDVMERWGGVDHDDLWKLFAQYHAGLGELAVNSGPA